MPRKEKEQKSARARIHKRSIEQKARLMERYDRMRQRICIVFLSMIISMALVPLLINVVEWDISLNLFGIDINLEGFALWLGLTIFFTLLIKFISFLLKRKLQRRTNKVTRANTYA